MCAVGSVGWGLWLGAVWVGVGSVGLCCAVMHGGNMGVCYDCPVMMTSSLGGTTFKVNSVFLLFMATFFSTSELNT